MPYMYHAFVNPHSDSADATLTRPSNWNARFQYSNFADTGPSGSDGFIRETLSGNRTYYVRTDGSDSNDGLTNTAAGAWLTIQFACDYILANIDLGDATVTVQIADGTYDGAYIIPPVGAGVVNLQGNLANNQAVIIHDDTYRCIDVVGGFSSSQFTFTNICFQPTTNGNAIVADGNFQLVQVVNCYFDGTTAGAKNCVLNQGATNIIAFNSATISGTWSSGFTSLAQCNVNLFGSTITLITVPAFGTFVNMTDTSFCLAATMTFVGTATGKRYNIETNGVIDTQGGGATYFPGDVAGTTATGGQYV